MLKPNANRAPFPSKISTFAGKIHTTNAVAFSLKMNPRLAKEDRKSPLTFFLLLSVTLFLCVAVFGPDGPVRTRGSNSIESSAFARLGKGKTSSSSAKFKTMMRTKKNKVKEEEEEENNNNASESEYAQINAYFAKFAVKRDEDKKKNHRKAGAGGGSSGASSLGGMKTISAFGRYWDKQVPMDNEIRKNRANSDRVSAILMPPESSSHASSLLALPNGDVLLAWFSGKSEGGDNVGIAVSKLKKGETKWSQAKFVSKAQHRSAQNPVLMRNNNPNDKEDSKHVRIVHSSQAAYEGQGTSDMRSLFSTDGGETWSKPVVVDHKNGAFPKNSAIRALNGDLILPMYYTPSGFFDASTQYSELQTSKDGGESWHPLVEMPGTRGNLVQPTIVRLNNNDLLSFFRSRMADFIYASKSTNDGKTWTEAKPTKFPNNNAGIQMIKLRDSSKDVLVLVFDNCNEGRFPLSIALSEDGGKSWDHIRDLEPDVDFDHEQPNRDKHTNDGDGEYSYPSIQEDGIHDGLIHVAYTFRRETIKYSAFMTDWIKDNSEEAKSIGKVQKIADTFNDAVYTERINGKRNDWEFDVGSDNDGNPKTEYMLPNPEELPPTELPL